MPIIELPNGQELEFPEGMSQDEMRSAIARNFPEYDMQSVRERVRSEGKSITQDMPLEELKRISNFPKQENRPMVGTERSPLDYESPEDIGRAAGGERLLKGIGKYGPELLASALVPEVPVLGALSKIPALAKALQKAPTAAKYGQSILGNALSQGGVAAAFNPETARESGMTAAGIAGPISGLAQVAQSANPYARLAGRLGMGAATGGLAGLAAQNAPYANYTAIPAALGGAYLGFKGGPSARFQRDLRAGLEGAEYKPAMEAAERLGLDYLTPAEASGNPFLGAQQGNIGRTAEGARELYGRGQSRLASEGRSIEGLFKNIFNPEEQKGLMKDLYKESYQHKVPQAFSDKVAKNEVVKRAQSLVEGNPAFREQLKGVDKNSIEYWDLIKRSLDDMSTRASSKASKNEARLINKARKDVVNELDKVGSYKEARYLSEREKTREGLEKAFNKKEMTGMNMYNILKDKNKFDKLQTSLRGVPEAQKRLEDMKLAFKNIITVPTARTASALEKTSMTKPRNDVGSMAIALKEALSAGKFDKSAVELLTNPKWEKQLHDLATKATPTEKRISKFIDLIGKAGAQTAAQPKLNINLRYNEPIPEEGEMNFDYEGLE